MTDGIQREFHGGEAAVGRRLRLTRAGWERHRSMPVEACGLESFLPFFGLPRADAP